MAYSRNRGTGGVVETTGDQETYKQRDGRK